MMKKMKIDEEGRKEGNRGRIRPRNIVKIKVI